MSFLGSTGCHSALMPKVSQLLWVSQAAGLEKGKRAASARSRNKSQGVHSVFADIWESVARKDSIKTVPPKGTFTWK